MEKLIICTGAQGVGKTTTTNWLREQMRYTNLFRLTGTNDKTESGLLKIATGHTSLLSYLHSVQDCGMNFVFDRFFETEEVYCRLGYKPYSFTDIFKDLSKYFGLLDYEMYYINLVCNDRDVLSKRLLRDKPQFHDLQFTIDNSLDQQAMFSQVVKEIGVIAPNVKIHNLDTSDGTTYKQQIKDIVQWE